jgi:hypothetical protein
MTLTFSVLGGKALETSGIRGARSELHYDWQESGTRRARTEFDLLGPAQRGAIQVAVVAALADGG